MFGLFKFFNKKSKSRKVKIYIVDDEQDVLDVISMMLLDSYKFDVELFTDPAKAEEAYLKSKEKPKVIICDVSMPNMSGFEWKKTLHSKGIFAPFMFVSGLDEKYLMNENVILKPIDPELFRNELLRIIS